MNRSLLCLGIDSVFFGRSLKLHQISSGSLLSRSISQCNGEKLWENVVEMTFNFDKNPDLLGTNSTRLHLVRC